MMSELRELRADIYELNRSLDGSTISFALRKGDLARSKTSGVYINPPSKTCTKARCSPDFRKRLAKGLPPTTVSFSCIGRRFQGDERFTHNGVRATFFWLPYSVRSRYSVHTNAAHPANVPIFPTQPPLFPCCVASPTHPARTSRPSSTFLSDGFASDGSPEPFHQHRLFGISPNSFSFSSISAESKQSPSSSPGPRRNRLQQHMPPFTRCSRPSRRTHEQRGGR